jgi:hypothetical protein
MVFDLSLFVLRMESAAHRALHLSIEWPLTINVLYFAKERTFRDSCAALTQSHEFSCK